MSQGRKNMLLRRHHLVLLGGLAALVGGNGQALAEDGQYSSVNLHTPGNAAGTSAGFRTSDIGAKYTSCYLSGTDRDCSAGNTNSSYPKNIGNILCLPAAISNYQATPQCQNLMAEPPGGCQQNSAAGKCSTNQRAVMPYCNYRTSSSVSAAASWTWDVTPPAATGSQTKVDCYYLYYTGVSN
jgi:hypothetical protein